MLCLFYKCYSSNIQIQIIKKKTHFLCYCIRKHCSRYTHYYFSIFCFCRCFIPFPSAVFLDFAFYETHFVFISLCFFFNPQFSLYINIYVYVVLCLYTYYIKQSLQWLLAFIYFTIAVI